MSGCVLELGAGVRGVVSVALLALDSDGVPQCVLEPSTPGPRGAVYRGLPYRCKGNDYRGEPVLSHHQRTMGVQVCLGRVGVLPPCGVGGGLLD